MISNNILNIIQPDDWHVHIREGEMLKAVTKFSSRVNHRCIVMPNLEKPIINSILALEYIEKINTNINILEFKPLLPCYLTDNLDLIDFQNSLENNIFFGAKLYPSNVTTNSRNGVSKIENIFSALEILEKSKKPLLVHGEKIRDNIDIFDREKFFIDEELVVIREKFPDLMITLEHVSSKYGADFVNDTKNIGATITPQHLLLTKKDLFKGKEINPHHFCMPVVKNEYDLIALRKYACSGNSKFFLGTDSAPHHFHTKTTDMSSKAGIFSAICSIELYINIFEEENSLANLEKFSSINGPNFYNLPINTRHIEFINEEWEIPEFTTYNNIKIKNFMAGKKINWKVKQ
jgi:dihydroorotase